MVLVMPQAEGSMEDQHVNRKKKRKGGKFPVGDESYLCEAVRDIMKGLIDLSKKKIIHRDIKTNNILYFRNGDKYSHQICDFGQARVDADEKFTLGNCLGTVGFKAPELGTKDYDHRVDDWGVGIIIFEVR